MPPADPGRGASTTVAEKPLGLNQLHKEKASGQDGGFTCISLIFNSLEAPLSCSHESRRSSDSPPIEHDAQVFLLLRGRALVCGLTLGG